MLTSPTAEAESTRGVVEDFLSRVGEGDPGRVADLFAETVDWMIAENPGVPWIRPRSTRADVAAHFTELAAGTVPEAARVSVTTVLADGADAVVLGHLAGTVRATGKSFEGPFALHLTVRNGLISGYRIYENSLSVAMACTPV